MNTQPLQVRTFTQDGDEVLGWNARQRNIEVREVGERLFLPQQRCENRIARSGVQPVQMGRIEEQREESRVGGGGTGQAHSIERHNVHPRHTTAALIKRTRVQRYRAQTQNAKPDHALCRDPDVAAHQRRQVGKVGQGGEDGVQDAVHSQVALFPDALRV